MILYFSGTGNSEYAAQALAEHLGDVAVNFSRFIFDGKKEWQSEKPFVIVTPTYAWKIPKIVYEYIRECTFSGSDRLYFVMTCGSDIGNAAKQLKALSAYKKMQFCGVAAVVMPENYIVMFKAPEPAAEEAIMRNADITLKAISETIAAEEKFPSARTKIFDLFKSGMLYGFHQAFYMNKKGFFVSDKCTGCGLCAHKCPFGNITITDGVPSWGNKCTKCMACISYCPGEFIEFRGKTKNKRRYVCKPYEVGRKIDTDIVPEITKKPGRRRVIRDELVLLDARHLPAVYQITAASFSPDMCRSFDEQKSLLGEDGYSLYGIYDASDGVKAFATVWEMDGFAFIEHFAVHPDFRGKGLGTYVLRKLIGAMNVKTVIAVEKAHDIQTKKHIAFYKRNKFFLAPFAFAQLDVDKDIRTDFVLMCTQRLGKEEFAAIRKDILTKVYKKDDVDKE